MRELRSIGLAAVVAFAAACAGERDGTPGTIVFRGGDALGSGNQLRLTDSVPGDAMLAAGEIVFDGTTGGDYIAAAGDQRVGGRIAGSARIASGNVALSASVGRNVTIASGNLEVLEASTIEGNAYLTSGNLDLAGTVRGAVRATSGSVMISGTTGSDVNVTAGELHIGSTARIGGDLRYSVPEERVRIDSGAVITGRRIAEPVRNWSRVLLLLRLGAALGFVVAGAVLVALLPGVSARAADGVLTRPGVSTGFGVLWLIGLPIAIGIAAATVVGIPLALLFTAAYLIVLYLSGIVLSLALGRLALRRRGTDTRGRLVAAFVLGAIALVILTWLPYIGGFAVLCTVILGSGALLMLAVRRPEPV